MKKMINRVKLSGKVYEHNLSEKVTGPTSKAPGTKFISGELKVATDDECLNVVSVNFTYVTEKTKAGSANATYAALLKIINGATIVANGAENALTVTVDTSLGLNDFYSNRDGEQTLVSAKRAEGGFVTIVSTPNDERNKFECDMLINGTTLVEADPEKNIDADYLVVKGAVFNFRNSILPVDFVIKSEGGIKYFESLDASPSNMVFTKVWGKIDSQTIVRRVEEESAFGGVAVKEFKRNVRQWVVEGAAKEPYDFGADDVLTTEDVQKALADREIYLADVKKRQDEYQASKNNAIAPAAAPATTATVSAAAGGFNF